VGKADSSFLIIAHDLRGVGELSVKRMLMNHFISAESLPDLIILIVLVNQKGKYACSHCRMRLETWLYGYFSACYHWESVFATCHRTLFHASLQSLETNLEP